MDDLTLDEALAIVIRWGLMKDNWATKEQEQLLADAWRLVRANTMQALERRHRAASPAPPLAGRAAPIGEG